MALNTLNLTNTRTTAKPVNNGKSGQLDAILSALGSAEQITQQKYNQDLVAKQDQLIKAQVADAEKIETANSEKLDLNNLNLKTEKGVKYRDEIYTSNKINAASQKAQVDAAESGETLTQAKSRFDAEYMREVEAAGTPEQKAMLTAKYNALGKQYSQNIFSQDLSNKKADRLLEDQNNALLAKGREELTTPNELKIWDTQNANQDAIIAANNNNILAIENNWTTAEQLIQLENEKARLVSENSNSKVYVNNLVKSFEKSKQVIIQQGAKKKANEVANIVNNKQQASAKVIWENPLSPQVQEQGFQNVMNGLLSSNKVSVQNAKNSLYAQMNEWNSKGEKIPAEVYDFLEQDRPDGRAGWLYTDGQVGNLASSNTRILNNQGKAELPERSFVEIAAMENDLENKLNKGMLTIDDIDNAYQGGYLTKGVAKTQAKKWIAQEEQKKVNLLGSEIINKGNNAEQQVYLNNLRLESGPEAIQGVVNQMVKDSYTNAEGEIDMESFTSVVIGDPNNPHSKMMVNAAQTTGYVPEALTNMMNSPANSANWETFVSNQNLLASTTDRGIQNLLRGSMTQQSRNVSDMYQSIMSTNPEMEQNEIISVLAKVDKIGNDFVPSNQVDVEYDKKQWQTDLTDTMANLTDPNSFLGFGDLEFNNQNEMNNIAGRLYNQYSITNPDATSDKKWEMVSNSIQKNYTVIGETMISNNTVLPNEKLISDYDAQYEPYLEQLAFEYLGDPELSNEITIVRGSNTDLTGEYIIRNKDTNVELGKTFMMESSNGNTPSFFDWANWNSKVERTSNERQEQLNRTEKGSFKFAGATPFGFVTADSSITKEMNEFKRYTDGKTKSYKDIDLENTLMQSPNYSYEQSEKEAKAGVYNLGGGSYKADKQRNDSEQIKLREQQIKSSIKKTRQKFNSKYPKFKKLSHEVQNKLIQQSLTSGLTIEQIYETNDKNTQKLIEVKNKMYMGEDNIGKYIFGGNPMYGLYKEFSLLERKDAEMQLETGIK